LSQPTPTSTLFPYTTLFRSAGHLAVAVLGVPAGEREALHGGKSTRQHGRHTGADRSLADDELAAARDESRMADEHAVDVGDRIERARRAVEGHAEVTGARTRLHSGRRIRRGRARR